MKQKKYFILLILIIGCSMFLMTGSCHAQNSSWQIKTDNSETFIENKGQFPVIKIKELNDADILFAYDNESAKFYFTKTGVFYTFIGTVKNDEEKNSSASEWKENEKAERKNKYETDMVSFTWENANTDVQLIGEDESQDYFSYCFCDNTGKVKNVNKIKGYKKIIYKNLYPNIDIEYTIHPEGGIKYALILHSGADVSKIKMHYSKMPVISEDGNIHISTLFGEIIDHAPVSNYSDDPGSSIKSSFTKSENTIGFVLDSYDNSKSVTIDPWVVYPNFSNSTAVWEVETDKFGDIYVTGGEYPMRLKKYNSAGVLRWTYTTSWDTSNVWLGTLATDSIGNSFITSGTAPEMERIDSSGNMMWHTAGNAASDEWWGITFNCDHTKLIVGGTHLNMLAFQAWATIFEMDIDSGHVLSSLNLSQTDLTQFGSNPIEVRSIASTKNAKTIFLTHNDVGEINQNFSICSNADTIFQVDNGHHFSYKCENYLPNTQNGGGLKALVAGDQFLYTHSGNNIYQRSTFDGSLITSVNLPGGIQDTDIFGKFYVENCGLAIDGCGNVYAGSSDRVVEFDANLNILSQATVPFHVYDVSVNSNGEVIAVGAQFNNQSINRSGMIQSLNLAACSQYEMACCDASFCSNNIHVCYYDPPFNLSPSVSGGTWSGPGITDSINGTFDPTIAGAGTFTISYTMPCGSDSIQINVYGCANLSICKETNGDLTVTGGTGPYTWESGTSYTDCSGCNNGICTPPLCNGVFTTTWTNIGTGTTITPPGGADTISVTDASMNTQTEYNISSLPLCNGCPTINVSVSNIIHVQCNGALTGSFTASGTGGTTPYDYTLMSGSNIIASYSNVNGAQNFSNLAAGTYTLNIADNNGCSGSIPVTIIQPASPVSAVITGSTTPSCGQSDGSITISASGGVSPYTYSWNTSPVQNTSTAINIPAGYYCVTVTDAHNCSVTVCDSLSAALFSSPDICLVTIDTATNQNIIIWEKPVTSGIDKYYIYREGSIGGIYNLIGTQDYSNFSTYTDITSNALQQPYRYKLSIFDVCGYTSQLSNYHQTIHLTVSPGMGNAWNLQWNNYEGFSFSTYNLYRGINPGNLTLFYSVSNFVNSFTDLTPPAGTVYYMIEAVRPSLCNPSLKINNDSSTVSNIAYGGPEDIHEIQSSEIIQIFPNPSESIFTIIFTTQTNISAIIEILNSLGQIVQREKMNSNTMDIDLSSLAKGIYTLKLETGEKNFYRKIMIE